MTANQDPASTTVSCDHDEYERLQQGPNGIVHMRGCTKCLVLTWAHGWDMAPPLPERVRRVRRDPTSGGYEPDGTFIAKGDTFTHDIGLELLEAHRERLALVEQGLSSARARIAVLERERDDLVLLIAQLMG